MKRLVLVFLLNVTLMLCSQHTAFAENPLERLDETFSGEPISLDLQDVDIHMVLQIFAEVMETNIVAHPEVGGKVRRVHFVDVPIDQAFDVILRTQSLWAVQEGNVTIIYPLQTYLKDVRERIRLKDLYW